MEEIDFEIPETEKTVVEYIETEEQKRAFKLIQEGEQCIFLTGKAGTGKSEFLKRLKIKLGDHAIVVAPTGVASINVSGQTIHSFFRLDPKKYDFTENGFTQKLQDVLAGVKTIIIDEISMVRADLMDAIDYTIRKHTLNKKIAEQPFGGRQIIMIGDPYQLPPVFERGLEQYYEDIYGVKEPYFFDAEVFKKVEIKKIEFKRVFRQKDQMFVSILNDIREGKVNEEDIRVLNSRVDKFASTDNKIVLTTTNASAEQFNKSQMQKIKAQEVPFEASVIGNFKKGDYPVDDVVILKKGCRVMFLKNNKDIWQNGTLGTVIDIDDDEQVLVKIDGGGEHWVKPETWQKFEYEYDNRLKKLIQRQVGSFTQIPLKVSYAITIHKSQGKTFDEVIIDMGGGAFAFGQTYVAISRCRSLEGTTFLKKLSDKDIFVDPRITEFMSGAINIPEVDVFANQAEIERCRLEIIALQKKIVQLGGTI